MNLSNALTAAAPVVGDGKLVPQHAYVLSRNGVLNATDGRQWVQVALDDPHATFDFCVRYEPLKRALEREYTGMRSDGHNGLIVSYGRGRARLKGIDPETFSMMLPREAESSLPLSDEFHHRIKDLMAFCADGDGHVWQQAVHMHDGMLFAANSFALAKCPADYTADVKVGIPAWACRFIANMEGPPPVFHQRGHMISFTWPDVELFTTLLTQEPPDNIITFASTVAPPNAPVPEGLKEAVSRIAGHGGKTCKIGNGEITWGTDAIELVDGLTTNGAVKTWGIDTLGTALEHAATLDLSGTNGTWAGDGYVGIFGGRTD